MLFIKSITGCFLFMKSHLGRLSLSPLSQKALIMLIRLCTPLDRPKSRTNQPVEADADRVCSFLLAAQKRQINRSWGCHLQDYFRFGIANRIKWEKASLAAQTTRQSKSLSDFGRIKKVFDERKSKIKKLSLLHRRSTSFSHVKR